MKINKNGKKYQWGGQLTKQTHGVTLIALIVTIIVLLILAGAVINMAVGADGIFRKASDAVDKHNNAVAEEGQALQDLIDMADNYGGTAIDLPSIRSNKSKWRWRNRCYHNSRLWSNRNSVVR